MKTVIELLHDASRNHGELPYLGGKENGNWKTFNFSEVDSLSLAFAAVLTEKGFAKNDNIAIISEGRPSWVIGEYGVLKAGCTSVPLSTKLSNDEIIFRLDHSESKAVLVSENNFQKIADVFEKLIIKPKVFCISPKSNHLKEAISKTSLNEGSDLFFFDDVINEGKKLLEDKSFTDKMAAIENAIHEDDTVTICYTSGTTGNPKGIMLTHKNYLHNTTDAAKVVAVEKGWKSLIMLPLDHSFAHTVGIYIFAYVGICMYFVDSQGGPVATMRNLPKNLVEVNSDFLLTVPALSGNFMKKMIQGVGEKGAFVKGIFDRGVKAGITRSGNGFNKTSIGTRIATWFPWAIANALVFPKLRKIFGSDIKFCVGGGALLEIKQQEFFNAIGVPVLQGYGLTENAPIICANSMARHKFGTSGNIIPTLEVRIMKDDVTECKAGEVGQIVTRGGSVMKGYYKNPEATAETLRGGWLWSGDLGYIDADKFLVVTGREKALLISTDGEKYSPETIEEAIINTSKFVDQIMAYNEQNKFTSALITLNVEAVKAAAKAHGITGTSDADAKKIIDLIKDDISAFKDNPEYAHIPVQWRPASFAIIPAAFDESNGLINSTMKLVRHKVREFYKGRIAEIYESGTADCGNAGNIHALRDAKIL
ncbi:MAG: AMP-binding protein [Treponema sp.]|jgi:long-chain acyl-CoA synthetase|nr:AMP-binding protein [Treponema sp.]